jgi:hypothetical protein
MLTNDDLLAIDRIVEKNLVPLKEEVAALRDDMAVVKFEMYVLGRNSSIMKYHLKLLSDRNDPEPMQNTPDLMKVYRSDEPHPDEQPG